MYTIKNTQRRIMNKINLSKSCTMYDLSKIGVCLSNKCNADKFTKVNALIDSGARLNAISEHLYSDNKNLFSV